MTSFLDPECGSLKGKSDYVHTVLLTELLADHLPRLPWFLKNLQCALEDTSTVLEKVCAALEAHPLICTDFVRIACIVEPAQPISVPVDQLVVLMGKQRVWTTVVAAFLLHELNSTWSTLAQRKVASIGLAQAHRALQKARATEDAITEQVYVSGVLSIAGLLPMLDLSEEAGGSPDWLDVSPEAVHKQQEIFGTDFIELGRWVRLLWRLPLENMATEVTSEPASPVVYSPILPKELYSPLATLNSGSESRNLILVSRGTV